MTRADTVFTLKEYLHRPVSGGFVFSLAGLLFLALAQFFPEIPYRPDEIGRLPLFALAGGLLVTGAVLQRRDAGLWPFSVPAFRRFVDGFVCPALRILLLPVKACWVVALGVGGMTILCGIATVVLYLVLSALNLRFN